MTPVASTSEKAAPLAAAGGFDRPVDVAIGHEGRAVAAGDFDGDGHQDLAVLPRTGDRIGLLFGRGDGTFPGRRDRPLPAASCAIAAGDLDGDGAAEVVAGHADRPYLTVIGAGPDRRLDLPAGGSGVSAVAIADVDGDGFPDVLAAESGPGALVTFPGGSAPPQRRLIGGTPLAVAAAPAGRIAVADAGSRVIRLTGPEGERRIDADPVIAGLAWGDFDRDGRLDLVSVSLATSTLDLLPDPAAGAPATRRIATATAPTGVTVADFDGDGRPDVAVSNLSTSSLSIYLSR
jgi:hypothetical protein